MKISQVTNRPSVALASILKAISQIPEDEVVTTREILAKAHSSPFTVERFAEQLEPFRQKYANTVYWGSRRAIQTLRKQIGLA